MGGAEGHNTGLGGMAFCWALGVARPNSALPFGGHEPRTPLPSPSRARMSVVVLSQESLHTGWFDEPENVSVTRSPI